MMRIVKSMAVIVATIAVVSGATYAWYSDAESITGTTFATEDMSLKIDKDPLSSGVDWSDSFVSPFNYEGLAPGNYGKQVIDLLNASDIAASTKIKFSATGNSKLMDALNFKVSYDSDHDGTFETNVAEGSLAAWNDGNFRDMGAITGTNADGSMASVKIEWSVDEDAGNEIANKSVKVNVTFGLDQDQINVEVGPTLK